MIKLLSRYADETGDGSGNYSANDDYDADPREFKVTAQPGEHIFVTRMIVSVEDTGTFDSGGYGNGSVLAEGIEVYVKNPAGEIAYYLTMDGASPHPVKSNGEWSHYCFDIQLHSFGSGNQHLAVRWTFAHQTDVNIRGERDAGVELLPGWSIVVLCQDSMTHLVDHHFLMQGWFSQPRL